MAGFGGWMLMGLLATSSADAKGELVFTSDRPVVLIVNMKPYPVSGGRDKAVVKIPDGREGRQNVAVKNLLGETIYTGKVDVLRGERTYAEWIYKAFQVKRTEKLNYRPPKLSDRGLYVVNGQVVSGQVGIPDSNVDAMRTDVEDPYIAAVTGAVGEEVGGTPIDTTVEIPAAGGTGQVFLHNRTTSWANVEVAGTVYEFRGEQERRIDLPTGAHPVVFRDFRDKETWWSGTVLVHPDFELELQFGQAAAPVAINKGEAWQGAAPPP